jgi:hypothetical protein
MKVQWSELNTKLPRSTALLLAERITQRMALVYSHLLYRHTGATFSRKFRLLVIVRVARTEPTRPAFGHRQQPDQETRDTV